MNFILLRIKSEVLSMTYGTYTSLSTLSTLVFWCYPLLFHTLLLLTLLHSILTVFLAVCPSLQTNFSKPCHCHNFCLETSSFIYVHNCSLSYQRWILKMYPYPTHYLFVYFFYLCFHVSFLMPGILVDCYSLST